MAAISEGTWAFLGVLVTQVVLLTALFVRQGRNKEGIDQINRAVNHSDPGDDTLVQRVKNVEQAVKTAQAHRGWERDAFMKIAHHVGCILPPYPHIEVDHEEGDHLA